MKWPTWFMMFNLDMGNKFLLHRLILTPWVNTPLYPHKAELLNKDNIAEIPDQHKNNLIFRFMVVMSCNYGVYNLQILWLLYSIQVSIRFRLIFLLMGTTKNSSSLGKHCWQRIIGREYLALYILSFVVCLTWNMLFITMSIIFHTATRYSY